MAYEQKYGALLLLRMALVLMPQNGYIHPDEFFQGPEVISGEVFDLNVHVPWEFQDERAPIRSMATLSVTTRLPLVLYKWFLESANLLPDAFSLLLIPRLFQTFLHLSCDLVVYMLCQQLSLDGWRGLFYYGLSHTALVMGTRTLGNSVESAILALLVCTVAANSRMSKPSESAALRIYINIIQGILLIFGIFHRPTFAVFAAPALIFDLWEFKKVHGLRSTVFNHISSKLCGIIYCTITCVLIDSVYYDDQFLYKLWHQLPANTMEFFTYDALSKVFVAVKSTCAVTPLNFILYNLKNENLAQHGLHPWYTHLLASLPGLLGPAVIMLLYPLLFRGRLHAWPLLCYFSVVLPLLVLSLIPHQEARFLLPCAPYAVVLMFYMMCRQWTQFFAPALVIWGVFNMVAVIFWGFLHQGGLLPMMQHISEVIRTEQTNRCHIVVFYHTYMPPRHLLLLPRTNPALPDSPCFHVEDVAGGPPAQLTAVTDALHARLQASELQGNASVHVIFPSTVSKEVRSAISKSRFHLRYMARVNGHFSGEDPPQWTGSVGLLFDQLAVFDYEFHAILT